MVQTVQPYLQVILTTFNIMIIIYGFYKFLGKPHSTLEGRLIELETKHKALEDRVKDGDRNIDINGDDLEAIKRCLLALLEFEISYCINTGYGDVSELQAAKKELHTYLSKR